MEVQAQIVDVDESNFEQIVIKGSSERVIVVDFWAPWCGPCRTLGPILEEVVSSLGPGIALVKVNVDENQQLAAAFRVQGIPAVKIVQDGQLVQEFTGALPKEEIDALLRPLVGDLAPVDAGDDLLERAAALLERGDAAGAVQCYSQHLEDHPEDAQALIGLGRARLSEGDFVAVQEVVNLVDETSSEYNVAQALLKQIELHHSCAPAGGRAACAQKLLADPDDLDARYQFACCAAAEGDYGDALKEWLEIVQRRKDHGDGAVKDAMVSIFHLLGRNNNIVGEYPRLLHRALH